MFIVLVFLFVLFIFACWVLVLKFEVVKNERQENYVETGR